MGFERVTRLYWLNFDISTCIGIGSVVPVSKDCYPGREDREKGREHEQGIDCG